MTRIISIAMCLVLTSLMACRGQPSELPPVHLNPNMDTQQKYKAQSESSFFADHRTMRTPPQGTVARGFLKADDAYYRGMSNGQYVAKMPVAVNSALLHRGQQRFDIYCAPCHDRTGSGVGIVAKRGLVPPPTYHQDRIRQMPDGELFSVISNGVRTMPSYRHQIQESDRWAIVAYVRALQRSQYATLDDVPQQERTALQ